MPHPDRPTHTKHPAPPSDELVLAAVARASLHQARDTASVPVWALLEHLDIPRRSAAARHVRERLAAMCQTGELEHGQRHGVPTWALSAAGLAQLQAARCAGTLSPLPEAPQHRAWQNAHAAAGHEIERFSAGVHERLEQAARLLEADQPAPSDAWLELGEELQRACRRLGSASYCLYEWPEPDDARADVDEHTELSDDALDADERARRRARRAGRRNVRLWDD